jgi:hypothetical protein
LVLLHKFEYYINAGKWNLCGKTLYSCAFVGFIT